MRNGRTDLKDAPALSERDPTAARQVDHVQLCVVVEDVKQGCHWNERKCGRGAKKEEVTLSVGHARAGRQGFNEKNLTRDLGVLQPEDFELGAARETGVKAVVDARLVEDELPQFWRFTRAKVFVGVDIVLDCAERVGEVRRFERDE